MNTDLVFAGLLTVIILQVAGAAHRAPLGMSAAH
jgi:hypothetical protein